MIALSEWPCRIPPFTASSAMPEKFFLAKGPEADYALFGLLQREALKSPGAPAWRMRKTGLQVGATFVAEPECLVVELQRVGSTGQQAVVMFSNEASDFVRALALGRQIVTQRIDDRRHLPEKLIRYLFVVAPKGAD